MTDEKAIEIFKDFYNEKYSEKEAQEAATKVAYMPINNFDNISKQEMRKVIRYLVNASGYVRRFL